MHKKLGNFKPWASLILTSTFCLTACGKQEQQKSTTKLTNGIEVDSTGFPAVVLLMTPGANGPKICTAFFVNEHQALTAAHCVKDLDQESPELYIVNPASAAVGSAAYEYKARALHVSIHPDYAPDSTQVQASDLAVVDFPTGSAPASLRVSRRSVSVNDPVVLVGYGNNENFASSSTAQAGVGAGVKRYGQNTIKTVQDGLLSLAGLAKTKASVQKGQYVATGQGDSGSPLLFNGEPVALTVAGEIRQGSNGQVTSLSYSVDLNSPSSRAFLNSVLD